MTQGDTDLSSFKDLAQVLDELPVIVRAMRRAKHLTLRDAAAEIGIAFTTVQRLETEGEMSTKTLRQVLLWLDMPEAGGDDA